MIRVSEDLKSGCAHFTVHLAQFFVQEIISLNMILLLFTVEWDWSYLLVGLSRPIFWG